MAVLSRAEIKHIADLAGIKLGSYEEAKLQKQLARVVNYISELGEVDIRDVAPTSQTTGLTNVLREDEINLSQNLTMEEALSGTEGIFNKYFVVPGLLKKRE